MSHYRDISLCKNACEIWQAGLTQPFIYMSKRSVLCIFCDRACISLVEPVVDISTLRILLWLINSKPLAQLLLHARSWYQLVILRYPNKSKTIYCLLVRYVDILFLFFKFAKCTGSYRRQLHDTTTPNVGGIYHSPPSRRRIIFNWNSVRIWHSTYYSYTLLAL